MHRFVLHASGEDKTLREIEIRHKTRGLKRVGYHYVIRRDGTLERGRPTSGAGAHCLGFNSDSIAICLCGDGYVTGEQWVRSKRLLKKLAKKFPHADLVRVGELDPWAEDPLRLDVSVLRREVGIS